jgi:kojibiose phosphorylase
MDWRLGEGHPSLLGVMGPDEYAPISSNNAYTNRMVRFALGVGAQAARAAGLQGEAAQFETAAAGLPIPRRADGLVLQCEEYERLAEPRFETLWRDRDRTFAEQVSQERLYRCKAIKQADVLMMMFLFAGEFTDAQVRAAYDYYLPYTTHDSSLSASVHSILSSRLGLREQAWRFWQASSEVDLDVEHGGAANGIHIAAAGANWQVAVLGFAGLATAMETDTLTLRPRLPDAWRKLSFPLIWKGTPVHVEITHAKTTVTNRGSSPMAVRVNKQEKQVPPSAAVAFP